MEFVLGYFNYWAVIILMMTGLYVVIASGNLIKKLVGIGVFQTSVFQLYITISKVAGGQPPIFQVLPKYDAAKTTENGSAYKTGVTDIPVEQASQGDLAQMDPTVLDPLLGVVYSNPLPHVLILTAIVVGVATLAVGLALVVRIREAYGSIEEADIDAAESKYEVSAS